MNTPCMHECNECMLALTILRQLKNKTKRLETNQSSLDLDKSNIFSIRQFRSGHGLKAARPSMKYRSLCTNQYRPTVHLYLYLYLHLYVQCNIVAVTVPPLRKKEVKEVVLTIGQLHHMLAETVNHYYASKLLLDFSRIIVEKNETQQLYNLIYLSFSISPSVDAAFCPYCPLEVEALGPQI